MAWLGSLSSHISSITSQLATSWIPQFLAHATMRRNRKGCTVDGIAIKSSGVGRSWCQDHVRVAHIRPYFSLLTPFFFLLKLILYLAVGAYSALCSLPRY